MHISGQVRDWEDFGVTRPNVPPVLVPWSAEEYSESLSPKQTGRNAKVESKLQEEYPPLFPLGDAREISDPCTIIDKDGRVLCWYLPGLLTFERQVMQSNFCHVCLAH